MKNQYAKKKDSTHDAIAQSLSAAGFVVESTHWMGRGWPDMVAGSPCTPVLTLFIEAKTGNGKLSDAESELHQRFPANWIIANSGACAVTQAMEIRAQHLAGRGVL